MMHIITKKELAVGRPLIYDVEDFFIGDLSSGCKAVLLAVAYPNCWVNFLEAGRNAWDEALEILKRQDMHILIETIPSNSSEDTVNINGSIGSLSDLFDTGYFEN